MPDFDRYWINAHERPGWFADLQRAFVDAGLCEWDGVRKPHPQNYALVVATLVAEGRISPADERERLSGADLYEQAKRDLGIDDQGHLLAESKHDDEGGISDV